MRRVFALLLAVILLISFMAVPVLALQNVKGDNGGNNGGSPAPVVGEGQQKEFGSAEEIIVTESRETEEEDAADSPTISDTAETLKAETEPDSEQEKLETAGKEVQSDVPPVADERYKEFVEELEDAAAMMRFQLIVILLLGVIICILLLALVLVYSRFTSAAKQGGKPADAKSPKERTVTRVEKSEDRDVTAKISDSYQTPATVEADIPPIGQTVILRKSPDYTFPGGNDAGEAAKRERGK